MKVMKKLSDANLTVSYAYMWMPVYGKTNAVIMLLLHRVKSKNIRI